MTERHISELGDLADSAAEKYTQPCDIDGFSQASLHALLRTMLTIRFVEEQIAVWVEQGQARCPCHLGIGQEAIAAGIGISLRSTDRLFGNHRSHGH